MAVVGGFALCGGGGGARDGPLPSRQGLENAPEPLATATLRRIHHTDSSALVQIDPCANRQARRNWYKRFVPLIFSVQTPFVQFCTRRRKPPTVQKIPTTSKYRFAENVRTKPLFFFCFRHFTSKSTAVRSFVLKLEELFENNGTRLN